MSLFIVFVAKSASGKSEIVKYFVESVAFTTREPRANETNGVEYYFKDRIFIEEEIRKHEAGESDYIVEWGEYNGHYYGTLKEEFDKKMSENDVVVNIMEIEGALKMRKKFGSDIVKLIWIDVEENVRIQRLMGRATMTGETKSSSSDRIDESHRDKEKELCDIIVSNNGTIEWVVRQIKEYIELLNNDSKRNVIDSIKLLKSILKTDEVFFIQLAYNELAIMNDLYNTEYALRLKNDIEILEELKNKYPEKPTSNLINDVIEYLNSIYILTKMDI